MKLSEAMRKGSMFTCECKGRFYGCDNAGKIDKVCALGAAVFACCGQTMPYSSPEILDFLTDTWGLSSDDIAEIGHYNDNFGRDVAIEFTEAKGY